MAIDIYAKSVQLLEHVAISVQEREPKTNNSLCFSSSEVHVVERWLEEFSKELKRDCVCLEKG